MYFSLQSSSKKLLQIASPPPLRFCIGAM